MSVSLWDRSLTLKNPSVKENRWSRDVCQLIAPRWKTQLAILPQPTDLEREKDIQQGLWRTVPTQEPVLAGICHSPIAVQGEDHLGEDSSTLHSEGKLPKIM